MFSDSQKRISRILSDKLQDLGLPMLVYKNEVTEQMLSLGEVNVDVSMSTLGLMSPVFKKITIEVFVGYNEDWNVAKIILKYQWEHPSGSNGYSVYFEYRDDKWEQKP